MTVRANFSEKRRDDVQIITIAEIGEVQFQKWDDGPGPDAADSYPG